VPVELVELMEEDQVAGMDLSAIGKPEGLAPKLSGLEALGLRDPVGGVALSVRGVDHHDAAVLRRPGPPVIDGPVDELWPGVVQTEPSLISVPEESFLDVSVPQIGPGLCLGRV